MKHFTLMMMLAMSGFARAEGPIPTYFGEMSFINATADCSNLGIKSSDQLILIADANRIEIEDFDDRIFLKLSIPKDGAYTDTDDFGISNKFESRDGKLTIQKVGSDLNITADKQTCVLTDGSGSL